MSQIAYWLLNPRGRVNRVGLLYLACGLLALQALFALAIYGGAVAKDSAFGITVSIVFAWVALVAASKRLHDLNVSAFWILWAFLFVCVLSVVTAAVCVTLWGLASVQPGASAFMFILAANWIPTILATLWLHFAQGSDGGNRFGPVPGHFGFSDPPTLQDTAFGDEALGDPAFDAARGQPAGSAA